MSCLLIGVRELRMGVCRHPPVSHEPLSEVEQPQSGKGLKSDWRATQGAGIIDLRAALGLGGVVVIR
jgi:hypothetical protein